MQKERQSSWPAYRRILVFSLPIMLQNLFSAAVSSTDVIMLNMVGQSSMSAVSLAVQYTAVLQMVLYGIGTGASLLCAQYWGRGNLGAIEKTEGIALRFSTVMSLVFAVPCVLIPDFMMKLFTNDPELIAIGTGYLRLVSVSYVCWGFSEIFLSVLRSVERVRISSALNIGTLLLNIFLNAVFIFGLFGAPRMGAQGAAFATSVSRALQLLACIAVSMGSKDVHLHPLAMFRKSGPLLQDFLKLSLPALINDVSWSLAYSTYSIIMGHLSSDVVAANSIVVVVHNFATVLCFAIASAACIFLGKEIGANQFEEAEKDAARTMRLTVAAGVIGGLIVLASSPLILHFASLTDTAMRYLRIMLLINTYYVMGAAVNTSLICGVFRAGGDTRFGMICDSIDMWCYAVPLGFLAAFVFRFPPMVVYFLLCTDEFVKWPWVIRHYRSKKWLKNITREEV